MMLSSIITGVSSSTRISSQTDPVSSVYAAYLRRLIEGMELHSYLYVDDTKIYGSRTLDEASAAFQQCILAYVVCTLEWMQANCVQLNAAKAEQLWCASLQQ